MYMHPCIPEHMPYYLPMCIILVAIIIIPRYRPVLYVYTYIYVNVCLHFLSGLMWEIESYVYKF